MLSNLHGNSKIIPEGTRYGRLVVMSRVEPKSTNRENRWLCLCDCGQYTIQPGSYLRRGVRDQCPACGNKQASDSRIKWLSYGPIHGSYMKTLTENAKSRKISVEVNIEDLYKAWKVQTGRCRFTGKELTLRISKNDSTATASVDRIDSTLGYTPANIQWVHKKINVMKMDMTDSAFIQFCRDVVKHQDGV